MSFGLPVVGSLDGEAAKEIVSNGFGQNYQAEDMYNSSDPWKNFG